MSATNRTSVLSLSALLLTLAACGGGGGPSGPASIEGTIDFEDSGTTVPLQGGSSSVDAATPQGLALAGTTRRYQTTDGEPLHALTFVAREPLHVRARARATGELALAAYDPVELRFGASTATAQRRVALEFDALGSFDVVLRGSGTLELTFSRAPAQPARGIRSASPVPLADALALFGAYEEPILECMPGELIVAPRAAADAAALLSAHGLSQKLRMPDGPVLAGFNTPPGFATRAARLAVLQRVRALAEDERVEYVESNGICHALGGPTPNDTYYAFQWDFPLMRMSEAWGITTGSASVIVAVIDTGETPHPDLVARQVAGYDFIADTTMAGDGDGVDPNPFDEGDGNGLQPHSFHGTHVSGTIGADSNNGSGVAGVTWATGIMSLRALGVGGGTNFDIANAVKYAAGLANVSGTVPAQAADVINMSLGSPSSSTTLQTACSQAKAAGVVLFAASGNENSSAPSYPAAFSSVISVAAVDLNAVRAPYSNFGPTVDICAPGGDTSHDLDNDGYADGILSTVMDGLNPPYAPIYAFYQGTSMACPHAAGVAALMLAVDPTLTPAEIETLLKNTAVDLGAPGRDDLYGEGLVDAYEAVNAANNGGGGGIPVLGLSPLQLSFGTSTSVLASQVTNVGSGLLDVGVLTIDTFGSGNWLSAVAIASGSSSSDTSSISVSIDRTGLADGPYTGTVSVASNGGTLLIDVSMSVDTINPPVDIDLYVLLVTADTLETVAQAIVNPTTGLAYSMPDLPEGDYYLVCGSDDDDDGYILGPLDVYAGLYPTINEPVVIALGEHERLDEIDFPVVDFSALMAPSGPGYRVLRR